MANINVLDDKTINQIAAGEVVERPVSVVKELVENAIDSGASNISVEIKDGGISLIRVTDNGSGIDKSNIKTAFLRHATSKISSIEDLLTIKSLGFRGEALSSISAVSQVELLTKVKGEMIGYRYCISGGRQESLDEVGIPDGTTMIVRNLFFNTPARRKFLKSPLTEGNYITELMERLILSHPNIGFKYIVNGKEKLSSSGNNDIKQNIYSVFGRDIAGAVIEVSDEYDGIVIKGFVGKPEISRGNRNFELFFVNNRYVKCPVLSKACEEAYASFLMLHKYPFVALYLEISSDRLDVNVHPAKTEIRFLDEDTVIESITESILNALKKREMIPEVKANIENKILTPSRRNESYVVIAKEEPANNAQLIDDFDVQYEKELARKEIEVKQIIPTPEPFESRKIVEYKEAKAEEIIDIKQESLFDEGFLSKEKAPNHVIVGQIFDTYWIVELDNKMYIIDQHAAHEKVLYERFKKRIDNDDIYSQSISPAIIVTLTGAEIEMVNKYMDNFTQLGFVVEHFGGKEYAITAVPVDLFGLDEKNCFLSVLDELMQINRISDLNTVNDRIATMACKAAIKGNMSFSSIEMKALIDELLELDNPYNCPHGRPTIISYSKQEIEKLFKRIV